MDAMRSHLHVNTRVVALNERGEFGLIQEMRVEPGRIVTWRGQLCGGENDPNVQEWESKREPVIIGHLGAEHWDICEACGHRLVPELGKSERTLCLNKLHACRACGHRIEGESQTGDCPGCGRPYVSGPDGMVYPMSMMGLQAAESRWGSRGHE